MGGPDLRTESSGTRISCQEGQMTSSHRSADMHPIRKVAVLLFDEFDLLDFSGPYEVFSAANRGMSPRAFSLYTVAEEPNPDHGGLSLSVH